MLPITVERDHETRAFARLRQPRPLAQLIRVLFDNTMLRAFRLTGPSGVEEGAGAFIPDASKLEARLRPLVMFDFDGPDRDEDRSEIRSQDSEVESV